MSDIFNPTAILCVSLAVLLVTILVLWAICLRWGLWWVGSENRGWGRVSLATLLVHFVIPWPALYLSTFELTKHELVNTLLKLAVQLCLVFVCLMFLFRLRLGNAFLAWLPTLLSGVVVIGLAFGLKTFVFEAFHAPTNSMAPTILGNHARVTCTVCGKPAYATIHPGNPIPHRVICADYHISTGDELRRAQPDVVEQITQEGLHSYDHFLAAKYLKPRRWDMITFHWPEDPEVMYIKRVVGMPGETVVIRDGSLWINEERLMPPSELQGIKYYGDEMQQEFVFQRLNGTETNPALLGPDEYFVLGDFTAAAADSRFWRKGAPGHQPFAVPAEYITGVVTHTFWPWHRMRSFERH